jgi:hypothetical protein
VVVLSTSAVTIADTSGWSDRRYDDPPPREVRAIHGGTAISSDRRATRRHPTVWRLVIACVALMVVAVLGATPASAGGSVQMQDDDSTTTTELSPPTTDGNALLVPGPAPENDVTPAGGDDAEADPEDVSTDAVAQDDPGSGSSNDEAEDTVRMVMLALIGVAIALGLLTVYYWWRTRPARQAAEPRRRRGGPGDDQADDQPDGPVEEKLGADDQAARRSSRPGDDDAGTVGGWQTDSTSTG